MGWLLLGLTARRRKERSYPELVAPIVVPVLVVLAGEVGGQWSEETRSFISQVAKAKSGRSLSFYAGEWNKLGGSGGA